MAANRYEDTYILSEKPARCPHCRDWVIPQTVNGWNPTKEEYFKITRCPKCGGVIDDG